MRLSRVYPLLEAYHVANGVAEDDIESIAELAWAEDAEPSAVLRRRDGGWSSWQDIGQTLDAELRARILARLGRSGATGSALMR